MSIALNTSMITNTMNESNNILWSIFVVSNRVTNGLLVYAFLLLLFGFFLYFQLKKTQDIEKSLATSGYYILIISTILYYLGKLYYYPIVGKELISNIIMLGIIVLVIIGTVLVYYRRIDK